jgi:hypothetical protein
MTPFEANSAKIDSSNSGFSAICSSFASYKYVTVEYITYIFFLGDRAQPQSMLYEQFP